MAEFVTVDASQLDTRSAYRLIIGCVTPRPIAWVSTVNADGLVNVAPFSSYNYVAHSPPMLAINIGSRDGNLKDTARNIVQTKEFVVNVPTEASMDLMHACSAEYPAEVSEADALGIALLPGVKVRAPRIAVAPIQMECRLERAIALGRGLNTLYIGEVLAFHLSSEVYDGKHVDSARMRPIARLGGPYYAALGEIYTRAILQKPPK
jgi:flavin reductase (DIM6/NTAB) family NADH-FMN oxidoreductase RutF